MVQKSVRICPHCGSTSITRGPTNAALQSVGEVSSYYCEDCNFSSKMFPEVDESEVEATRKELKENLAVEKSDDLFKDDLDVNRYVDTDVSYGKFVVRKWWKIAGPVSLLFAIFIFITIFSTRGNDHSFAIFAFGLTFVLGAITTYVAYFKKYDD